eukprot:280090-Amorphochlora_amoeboformis.AAC.1
MRRIARAGLAVAGRHHGCRFGALEPPREGIARGANLQEARTAVLVRAVGVSTNLRVAFRNKMSVCLVVAIEGARALFGCKRGGALRARTAIALGVELVSTIVRLQSVVARKVRAVHAPHLSKQRGHTTVGAGTRVCTIGRGRGVCRAAEGS